MSDGIDGFPGTATYLCARDGHEWDTRAVKYPENMDPSAQGRGDRCPLCDRESDQVVDWHPDDERRGVWHLADRIERAISETDGGDVHHVRELAEWLALRVGEQQISVSVLSAAMADPSRPMSPRVDVVALTEVLA